MPADVVSLWRDSRFSLHNAVAPTAAFGEDVRNGLTAARKTLPPRWFYDELGSALFDAICLLPEYYVTRAETEALTANSSAIAAALAGAERLVELGSGMARKTRILLDAITRRTRDLEYVAVDVDLATLERVGRDLVSEYADLHVRGICADFTAPSAVLETLAPRPAKTAALFLGSTIGNLDPDAATAMLRDLRGSLSSGDVLLLGVDLEKDQRILEAAYDDALGVTAAFNLNLLARINRELGGRFVLDHFRHRAMYSHDERRIEMHLVSTRRQTVAIDALELEVAFDEGETIHTENSYKHDDGTLAALAEGSGFRIERKWTDSKEWFADVLMIAV